MDSDIAFMFDESLPELPRHGKAVKRGLYILEGENTRSRAVWSFTQVVGSSLANASLGFFNPCLVILIQGWIGHKTP